MSCHPRLLSLFSPVTGKDADPEVTESCASVLPILGGEVGVSHRGWTSTLPFTASQCPPLHF